MRKHLSLADIGGLRNDLIPGNVNRCPAESLSDGIVGSHYDVIQACVELTQCLANPTRGQPNDRKGPIWDPVGFCHSAIGRKATVPRQAQEGPICRRAARYWAGGP